MLRTVIYAIHAVIALQAVLNIVIASATCTGTYYFTVIVLAGATSMEQQLHDDQYPCPVMARHSSIHDAAAWHCAGI